MKTTKHNLNAIALGVALAMGSVSALAANPVNPSKAGFDAAAAAERESDYATFESAERTGLALVESSLSLIAARTHIDPVFCDAKSYEVAVDATDGASGTATITGGGQTATLSATLDETNALGAFVHVTADDGSKLYDAGIVKYSGEHQWSRLNNIFLDSADWTFVHPQSKREIPYDEHSIKDYYKRVEDNDRTDGPESWEYDYGFEVITKHGLPVTKWTETSWYRQQDGNDGVVKVKKELLAPKTDKVLCTILYKASGFSPFEYKGTVTVFRP